MAPIKFEEDIKAKLESRSIEPSEKAWNKLSGKLDNDRQVHRKGYWWLAVAATLILALFTVLQVTQTPEDILPAERYTLEDPAGNGAEKEAEDKNGSHHKVSVKKIPTSIEIAQEDKGAATIQKEIPQVPRTKNRAATPVADPKIEKDLPAKSAMIDVAGLSNDLNKRLINEALEELKGNEQKNLDKETDSLLKAAQKALLLNKNMTENTSLVDANELLMEVELEAEPSIKAKVYDAIKDGFEKVKTAVAQRKN